MPEVPRSGRLAQDMWNKLGGELDWAGVVFLCEFHELPDPEALIDDLITIRNCLKAST